MTAVLCAPKAAEIADVAWMPEVVTPEDTRRMPESSESTAIDVSVRNPVTITLSPVWKRVGGVAKFKE